MVFDILKKIKKDLIGKIDFNKLDKMNILEIHFGVCGYIRNKYLWNNPTLVKELNLFFRTDNVDDLSYKILEAIKKEDF